MSGLAPKALAGELHTLHRSFTNIPDLPTSDMLVEFAQSQLDFRAGRPREDTIWEQGSPFTYEQKQSTLELAHEWGMLKTTQPASDFETVVVLGAHKPTLTLRTEHALRLTENNVGANVLMLACFRDIHPKEGVDDPRLETEADLAFAVLEDGSGTPFILSGIQCWDDISEEYDRGAGEYGVAFLGSIGARSCAVLSGSVPFGFERATTLSTLESLDTYLAEDTSRLLLVTTSLHIPYQKIQAQKVLGGREFEFAGVTYQGLDQMSLDSNDAKYRIILQEIGATIKNALIN